MAIDATSNNAGMRDLGAGAIVGLVGVVGLGLPVLREVEKVGVTWWTRPTATALGGVGFAVGAGLGAFGLDAGGVIGAGVSAGLVGAFLGSQLTTGSPVMNALKGAALVSLPLIGGWLMTSTARDALTG